jgi:hypothetical protein
MPPEIRGQSAERENKNNPFVGRAALYRRKFSFLGSFLFGRGYWPVSTPSGLV